MLTTAFPFFCLIGLSLSEFKGSTMSPKDLAREMSDLDLWFLFRCSADVWVADLPLEKSWEKSNPESFVTLSLPFRQC